MRRPVTEGQIYVKMKRGHGMGFNETLARARKVVSGVPGLTFGFVEAGPFGQKPIQISVRGPEIEELDRISRELTAAMAKIRGVADVETSLEKSKPELRVEFDRDRAGDLGLNVAPVAMTLRAALSGEVATTIEDAAGDTHDVRVRLRPTSAASPTTCWRCACRPTRTTRSGDKILVPLGEVAKAIPASGPSTIRRKDLQREVRISAANDGRSLGERPGRHHACRGGPEAASGLRHRGRRRRRAARRDEQQHDADPDAGRDLHLPDPGLAVRALPAPLRDHALPAAVARRCRARPALRPATRSTS